jgi:hypothetical protein
MVFYDFIEIGTSDFDTIIQSCSHKDVGLSIEALEIYLNRLPNKQNVKKLNYAISDQCGEIDVFYVEPQKIEELKLPFWVKGCNSVGKPHITIVNLLTDMKLNPIDIITKKSVVVKDIKTLFEENDVSGIGFFKIDTEGHDCVILNNYIDYCATNKELLAKKILFETNVLSSTSDQDAVINRFIELGYKIMYRNETDTMLYL